MRVESPLWDVVGITDVGRLGLPLQSYPLLSTAACGGVLLLFYFHVFTGNPLAWHVDYFVQKVCTLDSFNLDAQLRA